MAIASLEILLPETLKEYVERRVELGAFGTPSEYVRQLIRRDRELGQMRLEETLVEALDSGESEIHDDDLVPGRLVNSLRAELTRS